MNAADLFVSGGWTNPTLGYRGCAFIEIADLAMAKIAFPPGIP